MDIRELRESFNLYYNNISSNQAPGLDPYEISKYFTKAQPIIVDSIYSEYEKSEEARRKLANLVVTKKPDIIGVQNDELLYPEYTTVFKEPEDLRYIINEQVRMSDKADRCVRGKVINIAPALHDELDNLVKSPYRFNMLRGLRLDTNNGIEILTKDKNIDYYQIRYIKNPEPILLLLNEDENSPEDIIEDRTFVYANRSTGSLIPELHEKLVELAAKLAYQDYKS